MKSLNEIASLRKRLNRDLLWDREIGGSKSAGIRVQLGELADEEDRLLASGTCCLLLPGESLFEKRR